MVLRREDLQTLALAFGERDDPSVRVTAMIAGVIEGAAASVDAMQALEVDLTARWNASAELLDRVLKGVERLGRTADESASALNQARQAAANVMGALAESAQEAADDTDEQRPALVERMEALVAALAGRTTTAQENADTALQEWAGKLAGQQDELGRIVALAEEASTGVGEAMTAAHEATFGAFTSLTQLLSAMRRSVQDQLTHVEDEVVGHGLNAWAVGVDEMPEAVEPAVTALLGELAPPANEAGRLLAERAEALAVFAGGSPNRLGPTLQDLAARRERIDAGQERLTAARGTLPVTVALCRETAEALGEPW
jgi:hypothetical protein